MFTRAPATNGHAAPALPTLTRFVDLTAAFTAEATAAHDAYTSGKPRGPVSGLRTLDAELGGCFEPGLHVLHGVPGSGKTALANQVAAHCGRPALIVSC